MKNILFKLTCVSLFVSLITGCHHVRGNIGTMPILQRCANCNTAFDEKWPEAYFSSTANGLVCYGCEQAFVDKIRLTKNSAECLNSLKLIKGASQATMNEIEKILVCHFTALMHHPPKMAKHFLKGK